MKASDWKPGKIGMVLGGGGCVGVIQVEALQVVEENGISIHYLIGGSVGAINAAGFLQEGCSVRRLNLVWHYLKEPSEIFQLRISSHVFKALKNASWRDYATLRVLKKVVQAVFKAESIYRADGILRLIGNNIDTVKLFDQPQQFFVTVTDDATGKVVYFSKDDQEMRENPINFLLAIYASCAIPGVLPKAAIRHRGKLRTYIDGAYRRPLPIKKAIDDGCDTVIVIRCHSDKTLKPIPWEMASALSEGVGRLHHNAEKDEIKLMRERYPDKTIIAIEPEWLPGSLSTVSWKKGDFLKARRAIRPVVERELAPLIQYFKSAEAESGR